MHERLDRGFANLDLCDLPDYRQFLEANAAALVPLEALATRLGASALLPDWPQRQRRDAILADLAIAGGRFQEVKAEHAPMEPAALCGLLYVLEGSRLGGRVLLDQVSRSGDERVRNATQFLEHGLAEKFWQSFVGVLNRAIRTPQQLSQAAAAATFTFEHYLTAQRRILGVKANI